MRFSSRPEISRRLDPRKYLHKSLPGDQLEPGVSGPLPNGLSTITPGHWQPFPPPRGAFLRRIALVLLHAPMAYCSMSLRMAVSSASPVEPCYYRDRFGTVTIPFRRLGTRAVFIEADKPRRPKISDGFLGWPSRMLGWVSSAYIFS